MNKFSERFKQLKKEFDLSNVKLAKIIGVSTSTIKRWEKGLIRPKITKLYNLCLFFNVSSDYLLGLKVNRNNKKSEN